MTCLVEKYVGRCPRMKPNVGTWENVSGGCWHQGHKLNNIQMAQSQTNNRQIVQKKIDTFLLLQFESNGGLCALTLILSFSLMCRRETASIINPPAMMATIGNARRTAAGVGALHADGASTRQVFAREKTMAKPLIRESDLPSLHSERVAACPF